MNNAEIRRNLGGIPTGENNLSDMTFSITRTEKEPSAYDSLLEMLRQSMGIMPVTDWDVAEAAGDDVAYIDFERMKASLMSETIKAPSGMSRGEVISLFFRIHARSREQ